MRKFIGVIVGDQLYLERFVWFDHEARRERFPNANTLGEHFEIAQKTAQRSIDHFRDRLLAPLEYDKSHKGYFYTDPLTFKVVTSALIQGKQLTFCYYSPTASDCTMRTVEPHHMVNYMGNWHLIAFCHLRGDWRDFVLGRMTLCNVEGTAFQIREKDEWQPFLQNTFGIFQNRKSFNVVLRFTPERSRWIKGEMWHEAQKEIVQDDGPLVMSDN